MTTLKTLGPDELAQVLRRSASTIKADASRRPQTLPPRLKIPGNRTLLWLETDVLEWLEAHRAK